MIEVDPCHNQAGPLHERHVLRPRRLKGAGGSGDGNGSPVATDEP